MSPRSKAQNETLRKNSIEKIVSASLQLFSELGYERTSISQIAKRAGISKGLIYNYFDSKRDLLKGVFDYFSDSEKEFMGEIVDDDPRIFLENLFRTSFREIRKQPDLWRMILGMSIQPDMYDFIHEMAVDKTKVFYPLLEELFAGCGVPEPRQEARLVAALLDGVVIHYLIIQDDYPLDEIENYLVEKYCYEK